MDFRAKRVFFDRFSGLFGSSVSRPRRHKAARKFVLSATQSLQKCKVCGVHNTNCAVSSSFWNIFRRVVKMQSFWILFRKVHQKRKVFGMFSEKCLDFLSFWIIFQIVTDA